MGTPHQCIPGDSIGKTLWHYSSSACPFWKSISMALLKQCQGGPKAPIPLSHISLISTVHLENSLQYAHMCTIQMIYDMFSPLIEGTEKHKKGNGTALREYVAKLMVGCFNITFRHKTKIKRKCTSRLWYVLSCATTHNCNTRQTILAKYTMMTRWDLKLLNKCLSHTFLIHPSLAHTVVKVGNALLFWEQQHTI